MSEIYFIPYPCRPYADPYHDGHAYIHTYVPLQEPYFEIVDEIRVHCKPFSEPEINYSTAIRPREFEIEIELPVCVQPS